MIVSTVRALIWLHRRSADDLELRTAVASLAALFCYQFFLTNKQGNLWSNVFLFATMIIVARLHTRVIQDDQVAAWEADQDRAGAAELVSNLDDPASVNDGRPIPAT
jgi:acyl-ACP thioesterase